MLILRSLVVCVVLSAGALPALAGPESRVRSSHARLLLLLSEGQHRSVTFRDLVARLQASDIIVHVEGAPPGHPIDGGLQFVTSTPLVRYLRITVRTDLPSSTLVGLLGHELMHAVEVADSPGIRDERSFRHFYEAVGWPNPRRRGLTFDTQAAVEAGLRVARELRLSAARMSTEMH